MTRDPASLLWPAERAGEALEALAVRSGLAQKGGQTSNPVDGAEFRDWDR